jgi:hypothetical protein
MNNIKFVVFTGVATAVAAVSIFAAQAQVSTLTASCGSSVSGNQITWSASASNGHTPYSFFWTGDSSIAGATTTSLTRTYATNGTYAAGLQVTDASSSIATSTCSATVTANVSPASTSTLNVIVSVNNTHGGTAVPANFLVTVNGAGANPSSFSGASTGTSVVVNGGQSYTVAASARANYSASMSGNCAGPITAGAADACTITEAFVPPSTTTSTLPRVNPASLTITPSGNFLGHGMTVTSVASGSFQAQVWGLTYTINWSGNLFPEFILRGGNGSTSTTNPSQQVAVGDEVGVSGKVSLANPMVVTANVVRDYSIVKVRPSHNDNDVKDNEGDENHGKGNGSSTSSSIDFNQRLKDLLNQLHGLQNLFNGHGGDQGNH